MDTPTGERRNVAALIADVADSTGIGERIGPERSKFLFDEIVRLMSAEVRRFGGTVAQFTGDGLFAVFGAPIAHEDDSERAVRAARAIHEALAGYAPDVEEAYGIRLEARVGVNTGPVVLVGADLPDDARYNALGDTVNVAARLQGLAGAGGVAVGPATARQIERSFQLEDLGTVEMKGKSARVSAYKVVGELEEKAPETPTPLVGRASELAELERVLAALQEGRGGIVSVLGEPGIGKTRLVAEARRGLVDAVGFLEGHAVSYAQAIPYWPMRELVHAWLGVGATDPEARVRLELKARLAHALPGEADEVYPFLATILGLTLEPDAGQRIAQLSRENVQQQTFDSVYRLVAALAAERPLCVVFEDLHWADDSTLDLVEELLQVAEDQAVALFLLYRSERDHRAWQLGQEARRRYPHRHSELELTPLDLEASRTLVGNAAGAELPESVAALLADRAGGNPFFLEEALRDLVERGALRRENGRYELAVRAEGLGVPALVQEALQARLDRLEPETRELLNMAAVVGRTFGAPVLERLAPPEQLAPALSALQRLELVVEKRRRPVAEYSFRHGLVQEVAYASLLEPRRRELHRTVGRALEELHRESPAEAYGLLARHFSEADEPATAVRYLLKAGDAARAVYANEEALEHYARALAFLERTGDSRRTRVTLLKVALTHHLAFDFEQARQVYGKAFSLPEGEPWRLEPTASIDALLDRVWDFVPGYANYSHSTWFALHLFRGLVTLDREHNLVPGLAESFSVSEDGRNYRFRLREDACWSDGVPVTAGDFVYGWGRMREEGLFGVSLLIDVDVEASDTATLELHVGEPQNFLLHALAGPWASPWPRHRCDALGDAWRETAGLVGNGPFSLAEYDDDHALLVANHRWPGARGNVREARFEFLDEDARADAWREGRGDVSWLWRSIEAADTTAQVAATMGTVYVGYNTKVEPFDEERVRRAFSHALEPDRVLAHTASQAAGRGGFIPPAIPGHSHRVAPAFDLETARRLLAEAGHPDGAGLPELELIIPAYMMGDQTTVGTELAAQWARLGAIVRARVVRTDEMAGAVSRACIWMWGYEADFPDPAGMLPSLLAHYPVLADERISGVLDRAGSLQDQDGRLKLYREADRLLVSEFASVVPLHYGRMVLLSRPWIAGMQPSPIASFGSPLDHLVVTDR